MTDAPFDSAQHYATLRSGLIELGESLTDEQADTTCVACPDWTIREVYAHLVGTPADILSGRLEGVTTDPWTQQQVDDRADDSLAQILEEWKAITPATDEALAAMGDEMDARFYIDVWSHDQDIRGTLATPGPVDPAFISNHASNVGQLMVRQAGTDGGPGPLTVTIDGKTYANADLADDSRPSAKLTLSGFEAMRALTGRRSAAQLAAMEWDTNRAEPSHWFDALTVFSLAQHDVIDAT